MNINYLAPFLAIAFLMITVRYASHIAHWLNNIFGLPHPGPNDIQGACSCREHEGPNKYDFQDYVKSFWRF